MIANYHRTKLAEALASLKPNGKLNFAEKSVLGNVYQLVEGKSLRKSAREDRPPQLPESKAVRELSSHSDEHYVINLCKVSSAASMTSVAARCYQSTASG